MRGLIYKQFTNIPHNAITFNTNEYKNWQRGRVERMEFIGSNGNKIDGIMIYASKPIVDTHTHVPPMENPTVLFCNPNAGYYECAGVSAPGASWVHIYVNILRLNICLFNYRGYNQSEGVPSPNCVKNDGYEVAKTLLEKRSSVDGQPYATSLIIHGESIGGMVACYTARQVSNLLGPDKVRLLVCDRTFCSLDALARRMLGNWVGFSLKVLGQWQTSNVNDFLHCKCEKLILQVRNILTIVM